MKNLKNLGKTLNKKEQKAINGGNGCLVAVAGRVVLLPCIAGNECNDDTDCELFEGFLQQVCTNGHCHLA